MAKRRTGVRKTAKKHSAKKAISKSSAKRAAVKAKRVYGDSPLPEAWSPGGKEWARALGHFGSPSR